ncbi:hypothetical protein [Dietzia sp. 179-F 9C3 NHS]|uniref:hypothetical protein n=1 Tax=Dietzia sp. 179-F 9C3 NHS TaxID=3374295 RepID=UPI0038791FFE
MTLLPITPDAPLAHVYLNADPDRMAMVDGYRTGHPLRHCFQLPLTADEQAMSREQLAERMFHLFNVGDDPAYGTPDERAIAYRLACNRSLSVGDVVEIDGTFLAVASCGFDVIAPPEKGQIRALWE